jgi:hypothetical protein
MVETLLQKQQLIVKIKLGKAEMGEPLFTAFVPNEVVKQALDILVAM